VDVICNMYKMTDEMNFCYSLDLEILLNFIIIALFYVFERKSSGSVLESREYGQRYPSH
jgi:hypothetical protein